MIIINKYIAKEIVKFFMFILSIIIFIFIAVDYLGTMAVFLDAGISLVRALVYVLLRIPYIATHLLPVSLILSILIVFSLMNKNNELVVLKSSGISMYALLKPVILLGFLASILLVVLSESIVPITIAKAHHMDRYEIWKKSILAEKETNIWIKGNRLISHIDSYYPENKTIFGISKNFFDKEFSLIKRIDAEKGRFEEGKWHLYDIMEQKLDKKTGQYVITFHEERVENMDFSPDDLKKEVKKSEEMNFRELYSHIKKIEAEGYDATIYRVDLYAKTAFPLVCVIMGISGLGVAVYGNKHKNLPVSIGYGLAVVFSYWIVYSFCLSLGYGERLPPLVAAWITNLVYICIGALLLLNAE